MKKKIFREKYALKENNKKEIKEEVKEPKVEKKTKRRILEIND